ncbi:MAG TPA: peptidylprolyl isomerase [Gaiellaceae bacterium]|nr:peptidylprolyl isomerase [Gaiellaceae bacterium]
MKTRLTFLLLPLVLIAVLAAGCGGGGSGSVPADSIAKVGSTSITKSEFNGLMNYVFAGDKARGQAAPKVGTPQYTALRDQVVTFLVREEELQQKADDLGVTVTQKDVGDRLALIRKTYYGNSEKKLEDALKKAGVTLAELEQYNLRPTLLGEKVKAKVTSKVKVTQAVALRYYQQNKATFTTPETREVRHILVKSKSLANKLETKLKNGASFASLAKKYSKDPSGKQGGKLCVAHGGSSGACINTVPPFDKAAFSLKTKEISQPVHTVYGWHVIQPLGPVKPAQTQSFKQVESQIETNLAQQQKDTAWSTWQAQLAKDYEGKVSYQTGYAPATTTTPTVSTPTTTG